MRVFRLITCLWPGLAALWWRGSMTGLLAAAAFAAMINLAMVASFIWPELLGVAVPKLGWLAVLAVWCSGVLRGARHLPSSMVLRTNDSHVDLFVQAQGEYLRGHWPEAEALLTRQLAENPKDAEAILLLATLCRHWGRREEARSSLTILERLDAGAAWRWEIRRERELLSLDEAAEPDEPMAGAAAA